MPRWYLTAVLLAFSMICVCDETSRAQRAAVEVNAYGAYNEADEINDADKINMIQIERDATARSVSIGEAEGVGYAKLSITPTTLSFETKPYRGVVYRFDGQFNRKGNLRKQCARSGCMNVLTGTLTKLVRGKTVRTRRVKLNYFEPV